MQTKQAPLLFLITPSQCAGSRGVYVRHPRAIPAVRVFSGPRRRIRKAPVPRDRRTSPRWNWAFRGAWHWLPLRGESPRYSDIRSSPLLPAFRTIAPWYPSAADYANCSRALPPAQIAAHSQTDRRKVRMIKIKISNASYAAINLAASITVNLPAKVGLLFLSFFLVHGICAYYDRVCRLADGNRKFFIVIDRALEKVYRMVIMPSIEMIRRRFMVKYKVFE